MFSRANSAVIVRSSFALPTSALNAEDLFLILDASQGPKEIHEKISHHVLISSRDPARLSCRYFLFYWKAREQWQIHKRPAGKSCARLKTSGAPHLEAGWQVWKKKERSLRCAFLPEPEMTCSLPPALSVEEQILEQIWRAYEIYI